MQLSRVFIALTCVALLEAALLVCVPKYRRAFHWRAWIASLLLAAAAYCLPMLKGPAEPLDFVFEHGLKLVDRRGWYYWPALYLIHELLFYWYHRCGHGIRWIWLTHGVHHTSTQMTIAAGMRSVQTGLLSFWFLWFLPLTALGFGRADVASMYFYALTWQVLLHTELIPKLGPLELLLMTPSNHRMHHRCEAENVGRNFGGTLVVFDRLFSTYKAEPEGPKVYGIGAPPFATVNPFVRILAIWGPALSAHRDLAWGRPARTASDPTRSS